MALVGRPALSGSRAARGVPRRRAGRRATCRRGGPLDGPRVRRVDAQLHPAGRRRVPDRRRDRRHRGAGRRTAPPSRCGPSASSAPRPTHRAQAMVSRVRIRRGCRAGQGGAPDRGPRRHHHRRRGRGELPRHRAGVDASPPAHRRAATSRVANVNGDRCRVDHQRGHQRQRRLAAASMRVRPTASITIDLAAVSAGPGRPARDQRRRLADAAVDGEREPRGDLHERRHRHRRTARCS